MGWREPEPWVMWRADEPELISARRSHQATSGSALRGGAVLGARVIAQSALLASPRTICS